MSYNEGIKRVANLLSIKNSTLLITGASGLIGSCLIDVLVFMNKNNYACNKIYAMGRSREKLEHRFGKTVDIIEQDIIEPIDSSIKFDYIIHAASNADPQRYVSDLTGTILTNVIGNKNILDYCEKNKKTRMLLTSSFEVYGRLDNIDVYSEEMSGTIDFQILRNGYPESKRCSEMLLRSYVKEHGVNAVIARLSSVYGPTMLKNDSKAHSQFIYNAILHKNIIMKSSGKQKRSYTYVLDVVYAIFKILLEGKSGEAYNVSNENSIATILDVAKTCASIAGTKVVFSEPSEFEKAGYSQPQNCILDNTKLKRLGWQGYYTLKDGLEETINTLNMNDKIL